MHRTVALMASNLLLLSIGVAPGRAQTQADLTEQAGQALKKADTALNTTYDKLVARVSPAGKTALRQAQRTWVMFRDQECEFETFGSRDGSVHPMLVGQCATRLTLARTKQLQEQLDCKEGDLGCGSQ